MNEIAERYVRLVLAVGEHDPHYVDAYYGPAEWKNEVRKIPLDDIRAKASAVQADLEALPIPDSEPRRRYLLKQVRALIARVDMLNGVSMSFDDESAALYDVVAPHRPDSFYAAALEKLEGALPGTGSLSERYERFRAEFLIPKDRVDSVFRAAIEAARERTREHIPMTANEGFHLEYVTGEVWSGYNWYKGDSQSLIQINMDFPISIERAFGLACHEGYPGHHVYNALLEQHLVRERGWTEFSCYALFSPQSLIAEGTAEYGVELTFGAEERLAFERDVLYPLAGLDGTRAEEYSRVLALIGELGYASNDVARRYLDGKATRAETIDWLIKFALSSPDRAEQRIRFIEANRSYVVTYNVGRDMVREYVEARASSVEERWHVFGQLLSEPVVPSELA